MDKFEEENESGEKMDKELLEIFFMANQEKNEEALMFSDLLAAHLLEGNDNKVEVFYRGIEKNVIIPEGRITYIPGDNKNPSRLIEVLIAKLKYIENEEE